MIQYEVVQELKPGNGWELRDDTNPALNRGTCDSLFAAQETAEM